MIESLAGEPWIILIYERWERRFAYLLVVRINFYARRVNKSNYVSECVGTYQTLGLFMTVTT